MNTIGNSIKKTNTRKIKKFNGVYLDHAATGPIKPEVLKAMMPYLTSDFGNPSSMHEWGRAARIAADQAREKIANFLNVREGRIIFTGGGTEADNLAIKGLVLPFIYSQSSKPHVITSQFEHHAVLRSCETLEKNGVEVTYIKPNVDGLIETDDIKKSIKPNTILISIMYVNNEIGTVQPIREIGQMIEKTNELRIKNQESRIFFHTDAVQAAEYLNMDVDFLHVDLLSLSGHKIGAPKGVGALYVKKGTPIIPMMHGGEQEFNLRAGTENVAGIVGLGKAVELIKKQDTRNKIQTENLRNYFIDKVLKEIPETELNGSKEYRSPANANFYFKYVEGESILMNLDLVGIAASSGSACTSLSLQPSHVIMAVYGEAERAHGSIRFTLSTDTAKTEIDYTIRHLKTTIEKLRAISPLAPKKYKIN
jgi:cysteine desulfurase